jgi:hypothetical protein
MKDFYNALQAMIKAGTEFKPSFVILECPEFIANIFL